MMLNVFCTPFGTSPDVKYYSWSFAPLNHDTIMKDAVVESYENFGDSDSSVCS